MIVATRFISFFIALFILPGLAVAHGPTRQKASETVEIEAAPEKVWSVIENFGDFSWHPRVSMTDADKGNEKGSVRTVGYKNGALQEEELSKYDAEKMTYSTFVGHVNLDVMPATNYSSTITIKPGDGSDTSKVTWRAAFYRGYPNNDPPAELNDEASTAGVEAYIKEGLDNLKKTVESGS